MNATDQPSPPSPLEASPDGVTEVKSHIYARFLATFVNLFFFGFAVPYVAYRGALSTPESWREFTVAGLVFASALFVVRRTRVRLAPASVSLRRLRSRWLTLEVDDLVKVSVVRVGLGEFASVPVLRIDGYAADVEGAAGERRRRRLRLWGCFDNLEPTMAWLRRVVAERPELVSDPLTRHALRKQRHTVLPPEASTTAGSEQTAAGLGLSDKPTPSRSVAPQHDASVVAAARAQPRTVPGDDEVALQTSAITRGLGTAVCGFVVATLPLRLYQTVTAGAEQSVTVQQTSPFSQTVSWIVLALWTLVGLRGIVAAWRTELRLAPDRVAWRRPLFIRWHVVQRNEVRRVRVERHGASPLHPVRTLTVHLVADSPGGERHISISTSKRRMHCLVAHLKHWADENPDLLKVTTATGGAPHQTHPHPQHQVGEGEVVVLRAPRNRRISATLACLFFVAAPPYALYLHLTDPERSARLRLESVLPTWLEVSLLVVAALVGAWGIAVMWRAKVRLGHDFVAVHLPVFGDWRVIRRDQVTSIRLKVHGAPAFTGSWRSLSVYLTARTPQGPRRAYISSDATSVGPLLAHLHVWARDNPDLLDGELARRLLGPETA